MEHDKLTGKGIWIKTANAYRIEIGMTWDQILEIDRRKLKVHIREWDTQKWLEDVLHKPTLQWYREGKMYIGYDYCYSNSPSSDYLAKARTNTQKLEEYFGRRNKNHDKTCKLLLPRRRKPGTFHGFLPKTTK